MLFEKYLMPDKIFDSFEEVTPEMLKALGIRHIFSDIDNTLATYDDLTPPENVIRWCQTMTDAGITVSFFSNNKAARVESFNRELQHLAYWKAGKPRIKVLRRAMEAVHAEPEDSLTLGDQLLTDCAAGKKVGMRVFIVPPIKDKTNLFWKVKRAIERPYMKKYRKIHGEDRI